VSLAGADIITALRISGDGSSVVFIVNRDTSINGSSTSVAAGVWVINADGSGLRQAAGRQQIAQLLGVDPNSITGSPFMFPGGSDDLGVSNDGTRVVFSEYVQHPGGDKASDCRVFGLVLGGTQPLVHQITGPGFDVIDHVAISGDGAKVAYDAAPFEKPHQVGVVSFDGSGGQALAIQQAPSAFPTGWLVDADDRLQLSSNGTKLLMGSTGVLLDTATARPLQLSVSGLTYAGDPPLVASDGLPRATMDETASRFVYTNQDAKGVRQLATMELNPTSAGSAPAITNATVDPSFVLTNGRSAAAISARVTTDGTLVRVSYSILREGLNDNQSNFRYGGAMFDNGQNGDARSGDSIFASSITAGTGAVVGPRTVRIKAESRASDGMRHATAVEIQPFAVLDQAPVP
jgi:hypothetical protein